MRTQKILKLMLYAFGMAAMLVACNNASNTAERSYDIAKAEPSATKQSAPPTQTDVTKMEREASLRFRVKDVIQSTGRLEKMAKKHGGYVAQSMYDIDESETLIKSLNTDSASEIKKLEPRNHLELYVLNTKLDSFLDELKPMVDHLNYRHLSATQPETVNYSAPAEKDKELVNEAKNNYVQLPSNTGLRSKYALVIMDIYQTPIVKKWVIPNPNSFEVARGGFWEDFVSSVKAGGRGLLIFLNMIVALWPFILIGIIVWIVVRRRMGKSIIPLGIFKRKK